MSELRPYKPHTHKWTKTNEVWVFECKKCGEIRRTTYLGYELIKKGRIEYL